MSNNNHQQIVPFNRDKFIRALYLELRQQALDYKTKKEGTSNDSMFIGPQPILYDFFVSGE